jgi:CMP-N,N'-diacetyllegionaminic acid synthase
MSQVVRHAVLALVPARGGSKGVPDKNVRSIAGRTLLDYVAAAARESGVVDRIVLTTDSEAVAEKGRVAGLEVPFLRPPRLAQDDTPMLPVLQHALDEIAAAGWVPDIVVLLQPTSPLRRPGHITAAVDLLRSTGADAVVTVVELPRHLSPDYVMRIDGGRLVPFLSEGARIARRQDARPAYVRDGTVYAFRPDAIDRYGSFYGEDCRPLLVDPADSLSIDTPADWAAAEARLLARRPSRRPSEGDR